MYIFELYRVGLTSFISDFPSDAYTHR